ncbi:hypothetical protein O181_110401 [Austropuccinia psidii MF-1]|uniref:Uncharacterized protein n=1 Tax=Austropuccinia psidii MF-1 TaxID=1389203 RepID=A0A9Q3JZ44_9BASI|nr:hypothetical protein [Austropuccinia psidii MF-1]
MPAIGWLSRFLRNISLSLTQRAVSLSIARYNRLPSSRCMRDCSAIHPQLQQSTPLVQRQSLQRDDPIRKCHISSISINSGATPRKLKGSLGHIVNTAILQQVPTKRYFEEENWAIEVLPLTKNLTIPEHLGLALAGHFRQEWRLCA